MKVTILTNEYPPYIYGGAGVHVEYLVRELAELDADLRFLARSLVLEGGAATLQVEPLPEAAVSTKRRPMRRAA